MPELPEVESARRAIERWLVGQPIVATKVHRSNVIVGAPLARLAGRTVERVERRGKWLRITLDDDRALYSHLGMTGKWVERGLGDRRLAHEHARIDTRERSVRYVDPRQFGRLERTKIVPPGYARLGPDPLLDGVDPTRLVGRRAIKDVLLDQAVLAGIGNIQATEALFFARIDPRRAADALSVKERERLGAAILESLARTLAANGDDEITYLGETDAKNPFVVYGRAGEPCPVCRTPLARITQAARTTTYCHSCQT